MLSQHMNKRNIPKPTDAELSILRVLWEKGPSTVREVCDILNTSKKTRYTTALKFLQILFEKGLVTRDESQKTHVYTAALSQDETQKQLVEDLLQKAFNGSAEQLVLHAISTKQASAEDMTEIRNLIRRVEQKNGVNETAENS